MKYFSVFPSPASRPILQWLFLGGWMLLAATVAGQTGWQNWEQIYQDDYVKVELQFYYSANGCDPNGKPFKYRGRLTGQLRNKPLFVNFKTDYIDCNGNLYFQTHSFKLWSPTGEKVSGIMDESLEYRFSGASVDLNYYDVSTSANQEYGSGIKAYPSSKDPSGIDGKTAIFYGEKTRLSVRGGALGIGAEWVWREGDCNGRIIGRGASLEVSPVDQTTYFVRAEGANNTTACVKTSVSVDKRSTSPAAIAGKTEICKGSEAVLSVSGGSLGLGAEWVWYTGDCGKVSVGKGPSITVRPSGPATYFVRAESPYNTTDCSKLHLNVVESSTAPQRISHSFVPDAVCQGEALSMSVSGGRLAPGASWVWYLGECGGSRIGSGPTITPSASNSGTYYVRAEGVCNQTDCASLRVEVKTRSTAPYSILVNNRVFKGKKTTLTLSGGALGNGGRWVWYKNKCAAGRSLGTGSSISVRPRKTTTYVVRAEGSCNTTNCVSTTITPLKSHAFSKTYTQPKTKFLQLGWGLGLNWLRLREVADATYYDNFGNPFFYDTATVQMDGYGLSGELVFYPLMKEYFSLGMLASGAIGIDLADNTEQTVNYLYKRFNLSTEMALGFKKFKFLFRIDKTVQPNDYEQKPTGSRANEMSARFNQTLRSETLNAGFRFGKYQRSKYGKRGDNFDVYYALRRQTDRSITHFALDDYKKLGDWNVGFGMTWWQQSRFKIQFDLWSKVSQADFDFSAPSFRQSGFNVSLFICRNYFY